MLSIVEDCREAPRDGGPRRLLPPPLGGTTGARPPAATSAAAAMCCRCCCIITSYCMAAYCCCCCCSVYCCCRFRSFVPAPGSQPYRPTPAPAVAARWRYDTSLGLRRGRRCEPTGMPGDPIRFC